MIPPKLKPGDEIRIVAPSRSMSLLGKEQVAYAKERLESYGFKVTFGKHAMEKDAFVSSSVKSRVADLHEAFRDKEVKCVMTVIGGFNSNQLLPCLDYSLIKRNPKALIGYSDITALQNAIYAKTGLVTYSGPHFSTHSMHKGFEPIHDYFKQCLIQDKPFELVSSSKWSDDMFWIDQDKRTFVKNDGYWVINKGKAEGTILGGNLCTYILLQGTPYMPKMKGCILFLEDDEQEGDLTDLMFDRNLVSVLQQQGAGIKGLVIGRFQKKSNITRQRLTEIIRSKKELEGIPVIANADFGHTMPLCTFPIGGYAKISAGKTAKVEIVKH